MPAPSLDFPAAFAFAIPSRFRATVTDSTRWTLDAERIRSEMGETWCTAYSKVSSVITLRVTARTGAQRKAA